MSGDGAVERLAAAARREGLRPTALEIADALWLANQVVRPAPRAEPSVRVTGPLARPADKVAADPPDGTAPTDQPVAVNGLRPGRSAEPVADTADDLEFQHHDAAPGRGDGIAIRAPDAPALQRRALAKALRPLKRWTATGDDGELNATATADEAARTGLVRPIFHRRMDRWLDVAVVVDDSSSMVISRRTVLELVQVLRDTGAFRDIRIWHCNTDYTKDGLRLRAEDAGTELYHDPSELIDPRGRRIVLVASDCVGQGWRDGGMAEPLEIWAKAGPVAIVQPLPQRMWNKTGLDIRPVVLTGLIPGAANGDLVVRLEDEPLADAIEPDDAPHGTVVPIIELGERWLSSWAELVAGSDGRPYQGLALFTGRMIQPDWSDTMELTGLAIADPRAAVAAFADEVTPDALELARLFAAAAPLTLPVMRLIQRSMLPRASATAMGEVFLSGLLQRRGAGTADPDETVYEFVGETREEFIAGLEQDTALRVLVAVSSYLGNRLGTNLDFLALLVAPTNHPSKLLGEGAGRAFAKVAVQVLLSLGGSYREKAARLQEALRGPLPIKAEAPTPEASRSETSGDPVMTGILDVVQVPVRPPGYEPAGWKTVPLKNPNFVGRDGMLRAMRNMLINSEQTAVLLPRAFYGLGGVGKTQLAIEYAHRHRNEFNLVWWVAAEDPAEIRRSLVQLSELLGVQVPGDTRSTIARVLNALKRPVRFPRWLVVFDNVGDPSTVRNLLPAPQFGQVLITSREAAWAAEGQAVEVDKFARSESVELLHKQGGLQPADAGAVAEWLDDLPISLAQAAAWHTATGRPHTEYLHLLDTEVRRNEGNEDSLGYPPHAAAAMRIAFNQLQQSSEQAALLLQLASYFGPEWISLDLLYRGRRATDLSKRLGRTLRDQAPLQRAVKEIARWELTRNDTRNSRFQVHRLVRHMVQNEMDPELRAEVSNTVQAMLASASPGNPDRISMMEMSKHAELSAHIVASGLITSTDEDARQVVLDQIRYRYVMGDFESSQRLADDALAEWRTPGEPDDELTLIALRHRAGAIAALGGHQEALRIGEEVRDGFELMFGKEHEHTMATVNGIGRDLRALGRFGEARELDEENFERQERILGPEDRSTLRTATNFAVDLRMLGEYEHALARDQQTAADTQRAFGPADASYLVAVSNVARDLYALGKYQEALNLQYQVLPVHESVRGANHPHVLQARRTVVMSLRKLGRTQEAVDEGRSLLLAFRNRLGDRHPDTLLVMQSLMNALRNNNDPAEGDLDKAISLGEEALAGYEADFSSHPFKQICITNLAIAYRNKSSDLVARARQMNEGALRSLTTFFGPDNPYTLCCATNLANDVAAQGDFTLARSMSADILHKSRLVRGSLQPYTLACAVNHAIDLMKTNDPGGAEAYAAAIRAMEDSPDLGADHPEVALAALGKRIDCDIEAPPT